MTDRATRRLHKELKEVQKNPQLNVQVDDRDFFKWTISFDGPSGSLYENEKFSLSVRFGKRYPFEAPKVVFIGKNIPVHPHVYSNGLICLSTLSEDWSSAMQVEGLCLSIISMLASCEERKRPHDDKETVKICAKKRRVDPSDHTFDYHDERC